MQLASPCHWIAPLGIEQGGWTRILRIVIMSPQVRLTMFAQEIEINKSFVH